MGANGSDVQLSSAAKALFPYKVEAKNQEVFRGIYSVYDQAASHDEPGEPLLLIKMNRRNPLVIVDANHFLGLISDRTTD